MRHLNAGNKLGVSGPHRKAMLRGLTLAMLEHESIKTTRARAKELRWWAEHVITLAKRNDVAGRRQIVQLLGCSVTNRPGENRVRNAVDRLYKNIVPRFLDRQGGYTQIIRLAIPRAGDRAEMCIFRYIPTVEEKKDSKKPGKAQDKKKTRSAAAPKKAAAKSKESPESQVAAAPKAGSNKKPKTQAKED